MNFDNDADFIQLAAEFVKTARMENNQSQRALARAANVSVMQIIEIERGKMTLGPTIGMLSNIARANGGKILLVRSEDGLTLQISAKLNRERSPKLPLKPNRI